MVKLYFKNALCKYCTVKNYPDKKPLLKQRLNSLKLIAEYVSNFLNKLHQYGGSVGVGKQKLTKPPIE